MLMESSRVTPARPHHRCNRRTRRAPPPGHRWETNLEECEEEQLPLLLRVASWHLLRGGAGRRRAAVFDVESLSVSGWNEMRRIQEERILEEEEGGREETTWEEEEVEEPREEEKKEEVDEGKKGGGERKEEEDLRWFGRRLAAPPSPSSFCPPPPPPPTLESETLGKLMWSGEEGEGGVEECWGGGAGSGVPWWWWWWWGEGKEEEEFSNLSS